MAGPLIIKGVLDPEDAREAAATRRRRHRRLQPWRPPARRRALDRAGAAAIADAVGGGMTILADGGIRSGLDVVRMLALGAKGVLLGRAWAYALAAQGGAGVAHMLELVEAEMRVAMALTGVTRIAEIDRAILA